MKIYKVKKIPNAYSGYLDSRAIDALNTLNLIKKELELVEERNLNTSNTNDYENEIENIKLCLKKEMHKFDLEKVSFILKFITNNMKYTQENILQKKDFCKKDDFEKAVRNNIACNVISEVCKTVIREKNQQKHFEKTKSWHILHIVLKCLQFKGIIMKIFKLVKKVDKAIDECIDLTKNIAYASNAIAIVNNELIKIEKQNTQNTNFNEYEQQIAKIKEDLATTFNNLELKDLKTVVSLVNENLKDNEMKIADIKTKPDDFKKAIRTNIACKIVCDVCKQKMAEKTPTTIEDKSL